MQSKSYKRRLRRKVEKKRQKNIRRDEIKRIMSQTPKSFGEESSGLDETSDELLEQHEIFCDQNQETVIVSGTSSSDRTEHTEEFHDFEHEMNNDSFVVDSEEELRQWSSSDNNTTNSSENEQSESTTDNENGIFQFCNNETKEIYVTETIREWALKGGALSMRKLDDLLLRLNVIHPNLPKNYKTLLKTPSHLNIIEIGQAQLWYKSIRTNLDGMLLEEYLETYIIKFALMSTWMDFQSLRVRRLNFGQY